MNKEIKDKLMRSDPKFNDELKDIKLRRIQAGIDKELKSDRRITAAIRRHSLWKTIKNDIINAKLNEEIK